MLNEGELLTLSTILPLLEKYKNTPMEKTYRDLMVKLVQMGAWGAGTQKYKVEIEFVKGLKTFVMERTWHKGQTIKENPDGTVYLSFETIQLSQAAKEILANC